MSDTPETDAAKLLYGSFNRGTFEYVKPDFARNLERQRNMLLVALESLLEMDACVNRDDEIIENKRRQKIAREARIPLRRERIMNTQDKLQRIKAKCEELIHRFPPCESVSGWQSTIAVIELVTGIKSVYSQNTPAREMAHMVELKIIESWPEELL